MHIIFVTNEVPKKNNYGGGLATFTANIAKLFKEKGNKVEILYVTTKEEYKEYDCDVEIKNIYIPKIDWDVYDNISRMYYEDKEADINRREILALMKSREVRDEIYRINRKETVDIVHFCNHGSFSMMMDNKIPYVVRISGFLNIWHGGAATAKGSLDYQDNPLSIADKMEVYALKKASHVFAPSKLLADIGKQNLGINVDVVESPFVKEIFEWDDSVCTKYQLDQRKYILFYGNLRYLKGIQVIADLVQRFLKEHPQKYMVLAGIDMDILDDAGNRGKASKYVKQKAGIYAERVLYLGQLRRNELYPIIEKAEACLLPSRIENLSNACIEAMSLGKIVIATNGASFEQLIKDGESGFLCERDNAESFLLAINKVFNLSRVEKETMEYNAFNAVKRLDKENSYKNFYEYYQRVIEEHKSKRISSIYED